MGAKKRKLDTEIENEEQILGGGSSLVLGEDTQDSGERQGARQRDNEPDDFDIGTNVSDDRVRGAGDQSLDEITILGDFGRGLDEHAGGIRFDRPEQHAYADDTEGDYEEDKLQKRI